MSITSRFEAVKTRTAPDLSVFKITAVRVLNITENKT